MQRNTRQARGRKSGAGAVLLSLVLAAVLGFGGYFGVIMLRTGRGPLDALGLGDGVPTSDLPTDGEGNNLTGNSMQNLYAGGFMAMQGEDLFYANPADGGALYCRARDGEITKLTDFPVANLNVSGERMVFTDLEASTIIRADGGADTYAAASHEELWDEAGEDDHINYGGHLYFIMGIKSFCAGEIPYEELTIAGLESEERYQAPIMMEGGRLLTITMASEGGEPKADPASASLLDLSDAVKPLSFQPGMGEPRLAPLAASVDIAMGSTVVIRDEKGFADNALLLNTSEGDHVSGALLSGGSVFVETRNSDPSKGRDNMITQFNPENGLPIGTIPGYAMQSKGDDVFFLQPGEPGQGHSLCKLDSKDGSVLQVSLTPVDSTEYRIHPDGTVEYYSRDPDTGELIPIYMRQQPGGAYVPSASKNPSSENLNENLSAIFGGSYYEWDDGTGWVRVEHDGLFQKGKRTPMPWNDVRPKIGTDAVGWMLPGEMADLFMSFNKGEVQGPPMPNELPAEVGGEGDVEAALTAQIRMAQNYNYGYNGTNASYSANEFATVQKYYDGQNEFTYEQYIKSLANRVLRGLGLVGVSLEPEADEASDFWAKEFDFVIPGSEIQPTIGPDPAYYEATATLAITQRVKITTAGISSALESAANDYPGGLQGLADAGKDEIALWVAREIPRILKDPHGSGLVDGETKEVETILGYYMEGVEHGLGWLTYDTLDDLREHFVEIEDGLRLDLSFLPEPSGVLSGRYYRDFTDEEYIEFSGNRFEWYVFQPFRSGTYKINGSSMTLYVEQPSSDTTTFDDFSQSGDTISFNGWDYIKR